MSYYLLKQALQVESASAPSASAPGSAPAPLVLLPSQLYRLSPSKDDVVTFLKSSVLHNAPLLVQLARSRGLLWSENEALKFVEQIQTQEEVFLELAKHKFPELHRKLALAHRPTVAQASTAAAAHAATMPPVRAGELRPLYGGVRHPLVCFVFVWN